MQTEDEPVSFHVDQGEEPRLHAGYRTRRLVQPATVMRKAHRSSTTMSLLNRGGLLGVRSVRACNYGLCSDPRRVTPSSRPLQAWTIIVRPDRLGAILIFSYSGSGCVTRPCVQVKVAVVLKRAVPAQVIVRTRVPLVPPLVQPRSPELPLGVLTATFAVPGPEINSVVIVTCSC